MSCLDIFLNLNQDRCKLPENALKTVVGFLEAKEVANLCTVSRHFKICFDTGFFWILFLEREESKAKKMHFLRQLDMPSVTEIQRSISITLEESKLTLTKELIFSRALESLKEQVDSV